MPLESVKPAAPGRTRASEYVSVGRRDGQKNISTRKKFQQPDEISIYSGTSFASTVLPQRGKWVGYDASGHKIGYQLTRAGGGQ